MNPLNIILCIAIALISSCASLTTPALKETKPQPLWANALDDEIKALGSYNWIIVADSTFPALSSKGAHILVLPTDIPNALEQTIQSIEGLGHIRPRIYETRESLELTQANAPGITIHNTAVSNALAGRESIHLSQHTIQRLILDAGKQYRILVIKTETTLPYSAVYLELESGYWDSQAETALRQGMKKQS